MSSQRRVIVHVGQTKAGSTSIQNYLDRERTALLKHGFLFPTAGLTRKNPFDSTRTSGHLQLIRDIESNNLENFEQELTSFPDHTLILSAENIFSDLPDTLLDMIGHYFSADNLEILAILRPQFDWLRSRYIEEVLSGFSVKTNGFEHFSEMNHDALDYNSRLRHVADILGAKQIQAIPFISEEAPLVLRFLDRLGIPVTNRQAAVELHSNRREKNAHLVEGKRRLNSLSTGVALEKRLEIEHAIRSHYKAKLPCNDFEFHTKIPFAVPTVEKLRKSNQMLVDNRITESLLDLGQPGKDETVNGDEIEKFLQQGIGIAVEICADIENKASLKKSVLRFNSAECAALVTALQTATVSVHFMAPETALLAACFEQHFTRLYVEKHKKNWQLLTQLDGITSASPLVSLMDPDFDKISCPAAEIVIAGEGTKAEMLMPLKDLPSLQQVIFLEGARELMYEFDFSEYSGKNIGKCLFLTRSKPNARGADLPPKKFLRSDIELAQLGSASTSE